MDIFNSISLVKTYIQHTYNIFYSFSYNKKNKPDVIIVIDKKDELLRSMNNTFTHKEIVKKGAELKIIERTINRQLTKWIKYNVIESPERGNYIKK